MMLNIFEYIIKGNILNTRLHDIFLILDLEHVIKHL